MENYIIYTLSEMIHVTSYTDLMEKLLDLCREWCADPVYIGKASEYYELFAYCLNNKDFGDICAVYKLDGTPWEDKEIKMTQIF